jgi:hypothetical protein
MAAFDPLPPLAAATTTTTLQRLRSFALLGATPESCRSTFDMRGCPAFRCPAAASTQVFTRVRRPAERRSIVDGFRSYYGLTWEIVVDGLHYMTHSIDRSKNVRRLHHAHRNAGVGHFNLCEKVAIQRQLVIALQRALRLPSVRVAFQPGAMTRIVYRRIVKWS